MDKVIPQHQHVHPGTKETVERFSGLADDWLILVERGIEANGHAGQGAKTFDKPMIEWIRVPLYRLQPARTVRMSDCGDELSFRFTHLEDLHHERHVVVLLEPFGDGFAEN